MRQASLRQMLRGARGSTGALQSFALAVLRSGNMSVWRYLSVGQALTSAGAEQLTVLRVALDESEVELRVELSAEELVGALPSLFKLLSTCIAWPLNPTRATCPGS